ncbi:hypothetical protein T4B_10476 [Trichinella pseudospiralis]|uniref:Uncharacterized protein n=1 Tax=Trichinella pseudospiralis TaxID=6337 RepID=A0A0V1HJ93_TRIPS|nr:hypothetical protein T4B_10476 [Trichinella pseudospiralis]
MKMINQECVHQIDHHHHHHRTYFYHLGTINALSLSLSPVTVGYRFACRYNINSVQRYYVVNLIVPINDQFCIE